jgi:hypothetical protein
LPLLLFLFAFLILERVNHELDFHSNNKMREEGGDLCVSDVNLVWISMGNLFLLPVCVVHVPM